MKPHKHAELIKAWADGAKIEMKWSEHTWNAQEYPQWYPENEYRIKPEPKPDVVEKYFFSGEYGRVSGQLCSTNEANLKLTFDGETGELKSAEVLK